MGSCSPPKSQGVKAHTRAPKRRKSKPKIGSVYYIAKNTHGDTCGHKHKTATSAFACARRENAREKKHPTGKKYATYSTAKVRA